MESRGTPHDCPICLGHLEANGSHRVCCLKCGHLFGKSCITRWIVRERKHVCPTCMAPAKKKDIRDLFFASVVQIRDKSSINKLNESVRRAKWERAQEERKCAIITQNNNRLQQQLQAVEKLNSDLRNNLKSAARNMQTLSRENIRLQTIVQQHAKLHDPKLVSQRNASASNPVSQVNVNASNPVSQVNVNASNPVSQVNVNASNPVSQVNVNASNPVSQVNVNASNPVSQVNVNASNPVSQVNVNASNPVSQVNESTSNPVSQGNVNHIKPVTNKDTINKATELPRHTIDHNVTIPGFQNQSVLNSELEKKHRLVPRLQNCSQRNQNPPTPARSSVTPICAQVTAATQTTNLTPKLQCCDAIVRPQSTGKPISQLHPSTSTDMGNPDISRSEGFSIVHKPVSTISKPPSTPAVQYRSLNGVVASLPPQLPTDALCVPSQSSTNLNSNSNHTMHSAPTQPNKKEMQSTLNACHSNNELYPKTINTTPNRNRQEHQGEYPRSEANKRKIGPVIADASQTRFTSPNNRSLSTPRSVRLAGKPKVFLENDDMDERTSAAANVTTLPLEGTDSRMCVEATTLGEQNGSKVRPKFQGWSNLKPWKFFPIKGANRPDARSMDVWHCATNLLSSCIGYSSNVVVGDVSYFLRLVPLWSSLKQTTPQQMRSEKTMATLHTGVIRSIAFDQSGIFIATGSIDKSVEVFDTKTEQRVVKLYSDSPVWSVHWDLEQDNGSRGNYLYTGLANGICNLYDVRDPSKVLNSCKLNAPGLQPNPVHSVQSYAGDRLVVGTLLGTVAIDRDFFGPKSAAVSTRGLPPSSFYRLTPGDGGTCTSVKQQRNYIGSTPKRLVTISTRKTSNSDQINTPARHSVYEMSSDTGPKLVATAQGFENDRTLSRACVFQTRVGGEDFNFICGGCETQNTVKIWGPTGRGTSHDVLGESNSATTPWVDVEVVQSLDGTTQGGLRCAAVALNKSGMVTYGLEICDGD